MSYVSAVSIGPAALSRPLATQRPAVRVRRPIASRLSQVTGMVSASLEAGLLVAMMSGISLVLCTIAAGALL